MSTRTALYLAIMVITASSAAAQGPVVHINGPSAVDISLSCYTVRWEAQARGGDAPYAYAWELDGSAIGTNAASVEKQYCSVSGICSVFSDTISVDLTDFNGREASDALNVQITLRGCDSNGLNCAC